MKYFGNFHIVVHIFFFKVISNLTEKIHSITAGIQSRELCQAPISASAFIPLAGVVGESLSFSTLQINAKAAAPGFERETRGNLSSLSFVVAP